MAESISAGLTAIANADLSGLNARIAQLRAEAEKAFKLKGEDPNRPMTKDDIKTASQKTGLTEEDLMDALEAAKRRGLL